MPTGGHPVAKLSGFAPDLPTPFDADGAIDDEAFEQLCDRQIRAGATALCVCASSGEAPTLDRAEQFTLIRIAVEVAQGRVPVIAGTGSNATAHAIELSADAEHAGADAILSVVPYYNKPTQAGLLAHFGAIAGATGLPMIVYDVPSRCVTGLADDTILRLAETPRIVGLADGSGNAARPARLRPQLGADFRLLSADDATALGFLANGGDGCISVTSNIAPGLCRELYAVTHQGHLAAVHRLAVGLTRLTAALNVETNPGPLKYALGLLGLVSPKLRLPLVEPNAQSRAEIFAVLNEIAMTYNDDTVALLAQVAPAARNGSRRPGV